MFSDAGPQAASMPGWSPPPGSPAGPPPVGDYTRRLALYFSPRVMVWVAPICFLAIFVLMFFPWAGVYGGSQHLVRQSGVQLAFGGYSEARKDAWSDMWKSKGLPLMGAGETAEESKPPSVWSPMILVYFLLICVSVVAAVAFLVLPKAAPAVAEKLKPWRPLGFTLLSFLTLLFLGLQVLFGFPLENRLADKVDKAYEEQLKQAKEHYDEAMKKAEDKKEKEQLTRTYEEGRVMAEFAYGIAHSMLQHRMALKLALLLNVLAMVGSLLEFALARRGLKPLPRIVFER